jgi:hypothetical protein
LTEKAQVTCDKKEEKKRGVQGRSGMYYSLGEEEAVILDHRDSADAAGLLEVLRGARVLACRVSAR